MWNCMVSMATYVFLKNGDVPTKVFISQQQLIGNFKLGTNWMLRQRTFIQCSDMQIIKLSNCIFVNINENIGNKRKKIIKNKGVYMQIYLQLSCLLSYTTSLGTNLMLIHSLFT